MDRVQPPPECPPARKDWTLGHGRALTLQAAEVASIEALSGALWVTGTGNAQDFFVPHGDRLDVPVNHGQVVVEAMADGAVLRVAQHVLAARGAPQPSFARAVQVSLVQPLGRGLRRLADWLDPAAPALNTH